MATLTETARPAVLTNVSPTALSPVLNGATNGATNGASNGEGCEELGQAAGGLGSPAPQTRPRRWLRQWVRVETVLNNGKCFILKWVTAEETKVPPQTAKPLESQTPTALRGVGTVYVCNFENCGKVFMEAGALRKHSHVHGERQYICQYEGCGKRFVDSSKLKRHHLIHTGEKHFICPFEGCGKAFSLDFNRRSHMRTHTGENYHSCPVVDCGKRFAHENKLRAHMQSAHPDKDTNGGESEKEEPADPKGMEDGPGGEAEMDRPFVCPHGGCGKRYIHEYKLNLHLRKEHGSQNEGTNGEARSKAVGGKVADGDSEEDERENMPLILSRAKDFGMEGEPKKRRRRKKKEKEEKQEPPQKKKRGRPPKDKSKLLEQQKAAPSSQKITFVERRPDELARERSQGESSEGREGSGMGRTRSFTEEVEEEVVEMEVEEEEEEEEEEGEEEGRGGDDDMVGGYMRGGYAKELDEDGTDEESDEDQ